MPYYDAGDAAIYYEISGEGRPLVLLHGYALNSLMWALQRPLLERKYQLILIDLRGFGQSSCGSRWSSGVLAEDVAGIIGSLDLHDVAILGFSMSGPVAFRIALQNPDRISALVLASAILPSTGAAQSAGAVKSFEKEIEILATEGIEGWVEKTGLRTGPLVDNMFKLNPDIISIWDEILARHNPDFLRAMMAARIKASPRTNWRERLKEITHPTLVIAGALDTKFLDASRYYQRAISGSNLQIIEHAGHMVNLENPEEFSQALISFLDSIAI
jgi:pimeloyl-ACP methyl ester carboxylesterase